MYCIDFEYKATNKQNYDVVSVAIEEPNGTKRNWWLYQDDCAKEEFKKYMATKLGVVFISYAALAECRALHSIGINPLDFRWVDLYVEWRQLKNHNDLWNFGWVKDKEGKIFKSVPYHIEGISKETGLGLTDCALRVLKLDLDAAHKNKMREIIINERDFTSEHIADILKYGESDVTFLRSIYERMLLYYTKRFGLDKRHDFINRGQFIAALSFSEYNGIPLDMSALRNIQGYHSEIEDEIVNDMNSVFELFLPKKAGGWTFKHNLFGELIEQLHLAEKWPTTAKGRFATDGKTVEKFRMVPEIEKLYQTLKTRKSINFVKDPEKTGQYIGNDGNIRPYFGPFGTQTGRNAAKATSFPPAMANWCRCLMRPPKGKTIIGIDYGSQEFAIGASLSGDKNMIEAYQSGDPYLYFAKKAKAVPQDGKREDHEATRNLFKATVLGVQYGMGVNKLADKLSYDMKRKVEVEEARELIYLHKKVFSEYWKWLGHCEWKMFDQKYLQTKDGWMMFNGNKNSLSIKNFLVQGTGASTMRKALVRCVDAGLKVLYPLHDALYFICDDEDVAETIETAKRCMQEANKSYINIEIRMDVDKHSHDEIWVEYRGRNDWEKLKKYMY